MLPLNHSAIGLIAGEGKFPILFAQESKKNNREVVVITLKEEPHEDFSPYAKAIHSVSLGQLDTIIQTLKKEGVKEVVVAGRVHHAKLFSDFIPDLRAAQLLLRIKDRRADSILSAVANEFEKDGIALLPSTTFLSHLVPEVGLLTKRKLTESEEKNVEFGIRMAQGLAALDCGQTVVVKKRMVLAVEAIEGTNECIRRGAKFGGEDIIVVKSAKPGQDLRFDLPVIGLNTIAVLKETKAKVLAIEAKKTLILEKEKCIQSANGEGIAIIAWERSEK